MIVSAGGIEPDTFVSSGRRFCNQYSKRRGWVVLPACGWFTLWLVVKQFTKSFGRERPAKGEPTWEVQDVENRWFHHEVVPHEALEAGYSAKGSIEACIAPEGERKSGSVGTMLDGKRFEPVLTSAMRKNIKSVEPQDAAIVMHASSSEKNRAIDGVRARREKGLQQASAFVSEIPVD